MGLTIWTLAYLALDRPLEAGVAFALIAAGTVLYLATGGTSSTTSGPDPEA
jgi:hypothetical protein